LKTVWLLRAIQPPSEVILPVMIAGSPGAQVICSTGLFLSSQVDASTSFFPSMIGGMRAFTLLAGHKSPVGAKM
jgi:hypothetical protein